MEGVVNKKIGGENEKSTKEIKIAGRIGILGKRWRWYWRRGAETVNDWFEFEGVIWGDNKGPAGHIRRVWEETLVKNKTVQTKKNEI